MASSSDVNGLFSPGPWWGFNGVVRLSATDDCLVISPCGGWKAAHREERRIPLRNVEVLSRRTRRGLLGRPDVLVAKIRIDGKDSTYTSKELSAVDVLDALTRAPGIA